MGSTEKILLVQLYSNGDCLYATTVARQIKHDFPGCHLTWAIASFCKNIIANNPYVDEIMEINDVQKNNSRSVYCLIKQLQKLKGKTYDEVFITQDTFGDTHANFDGWIRSKIFNSYPNKITVPIQPTLVLYEAEIQRARDFYTANSLGEFDKIILFEFAPLSGQIKITKQSALLIAQAITSLDPTIAIVLSSADKIENVSKQIIDGSSLSLRETAAFTHYCNYLLGCSSGITWISTSSGAKLLPMVQLIDPTAIYLNSPANDFDRFNLKSQGIIELHDFSVSTISNCFKQIFDKGFTAAIKDYHRNTSINFKTTPYIVYDTLTSLKLKSLCTHWKVNYRARGINGRFILAFLKGIFFTPFNFIKNKLRKSRLFLREKQH